MRTDIFLYSTDKDASAEYVRSAIVSSVTDANYLWYLLSGSGYIHTDNDTEDAEAITVEQLAEVEYDVDNALQHIDGTQQLTDLLSRTEMAHAYKWADGPVDKLTAVCLAIYRALA